MAASKSLTIKKQKDKRKEILESCLNEGDSGSKTADWANLLATAK